MRKIKYCVKVVKWRDKTTWEEYFSARVTRTEDGAVLAVPFQYGYGERYRFVTLAEMVLHGWIPEKYRDSLYLYERENGYPILWCVCEGRKCEAIENGRGKVSRWEEKQEVVRF